MSSPRYEVMVIRRPPVPFWLRALGGLSGRLAARLYFNHYPPYSSIWRVNMERAAAMVSVQQVAEEAPGAYVLVEIDEDDLPPQIILRVVTDPSFEGFTADVVKEET